MRDELILSIPRKHLRATYALIIIETILLVALAGCSHPSKEAEQHYDLNGKVLAIDKRGGTVTIAHEAIPGYMEAMAMPFKLKDKWAYEELAVGDTVQATLVVQGESVWLESLVFVRQTSEPGGTATSPEPAPGSETPDFKLINQDGKPIHLGQYRNRALILTFIYTRCPLPDYCPLMTNRFTDVLKDLKDNTVLNGKAHLLSISIDPDYDKPAVLRQYAEHNAGLSKFDDWEFASGTLEEVKKVATYFGLQYWEEGGQIIHSLRTAVIAPDGKLVTLYRGNDWKPEQIIADLQSLNLD